MFLKSVECANHSYDFLFSYSSRALMAGIMPETVLYPSSNFFPFFFSFIYFFFFLVGSRHLIRVWPESEFTFPGHSDFRICGSGALGTSSYASWTVSPPLTFSLVTPGAFRRNGCLVPTLSRSPTADGFQGYLWESPAFCTRVLSGPFFFFSGYLWFEGLRKKLQQRQCSHWFQRSKRFFFFFSFFFFFPALSNLEVGIFAVNSISPQLFFFFRSDQVYFFGERYMTN